MVLKKDQTGGWEESTAPGLERRRFERIANILVFQCRFSGGAEDFKVFTDNVCVQGARVITGQPILEGDLLNIHVMLYSSLSSFDVKGRVAWARPLGLQQFEGGIEFVEIDAAARNQWEQFINRFRI